MEFFGPAQFFAPAFLFWRGGVGGIGLCSGVEAQHAEVVGGFAGFRQGSVEEFGFVGFDFDDEAVGPRLPMNRAALDFAEIDIAMGERLEGGKERAGSMRELHCNRHFAGVGGGRDCGGVGFAAEQDEAREIFGVVLNFFSEDHALVVFGGATAGDRGGNCVATPEDLADAAGRIFGGDALEQRMLREEAFALRERHGMRGDGFDSFERCAGDRDEIELDGENCFGGDRQLILKHEVVDADDRTGERIFDGDKQSLGGVFGNGAEHRVERGARHRGDFGAQELNGSGFAEGAGFTLEGYAERFW